MLVSIPQSTETQVAAARRVSRQRTTDTFRAVSTSTSHHGGTMYDDR